MSSKKPSKVGEFFLRWNLTTTSLTDKRGFTVSNAIVVKAMKFIEEDCVRKIKSDALDGGVAYEEWVVDPIDGYNSTAYSLSLWDYGDHLTIACNCQWCCMHEKTCSHALAVLVTSKRAGVPRTIKARIREKKKVKTPPSKMESDRDVDDAINAFERWEN